MIRHTLLVILLGCLSQISVSAVEPWRTDVDLALEDGHGQLIVMVFSADWCVWCHRLLEDSAQDDRITALLENQVTPIEVDIDKNASLAQRLDVAGIPATVFINRRGEVVHRINGYREPETILAELELFIEQADEIEGEPLNVWFEQVLTTITTSQLITDIGSGSPEERRARRRELVTRSDIHFDALWQNLTHHRLRVRVDTATILAAHFGEPVGYDPFYVDDALVAGKQAWQQAIGDQHSEPIIP